jgi:hypothetical protein
MERMGAVPLAFHYPECAREMHRTGSKQTPSIAQKKKGISGKKNQSRRIARPMKVSSFSLPHSLAMKHKAKRHQN